MSHQLLRAGKYSTPSTGRVRQDSNRLGLAPWPKTIEFHGSFDLPTWGTLPVVTGVVGVEAVFGWVNVVVQLPLPSPSTPVVTVTLVLPGADVGLSGFRVS